MKKLSIERQILLGLANRRRLTYKDYILAKKASREDSKKHWSKRSVIISKMLLAASNSWLESRYAYNSAKSIVDNYYRTQVEKHD